MGSSSGSPGYTSPRLLNSVFSTVPTPVEIIQLGPKRGQWA